MHSNSEGNRGINVEIPINDDGREVVNEKGELVVTSREYRQPIIIDNVQEQNKSVKQEIVTSIESDRLTYNPGEVVVFTVTFADLEGNVIDPDEIKAYYDSNMIELQRQDTGVYAYTTSGLTKANHQIVVNAEKTGFAEDTTYLSISVQHIM